MRRVVVLGAIVVAMLAVFGNRVFHDSANDTVVDRVKAQHEDAAWMKHVTSWRTTAAIRVETDYERTDLAAYVHGYDICRAVTSAYADGANDLPPLQVYGVDTATQRKIDGSTSQDVDRVLIAQSTRVDDYQCGITPPDDLLKQARSLGMPIHRR